jgi:hypothetical protein
LCLKARDGRYLKRFRNPKSWFRPIHMGRVCRTWNVDLFKKFRIRRTHRKLGWCIRLAYVKGFRGALWLARWGRRGKNKINLSKCLVHPKNSKLPQVMPDGSSNDKTCGCIGRDGRKCGPKNARSQIRGWSQQDIDLARARHWRAIHFRTPRDGKHDYKEVAGRKGKFDYAFKAGGKPKKKEG